MTVPEPTVRRAVALVDGQNLFHAAREAFGYTYPSYDVLTLAGAVCASQGWKLIQTRFYTGIPDASDNPFWHDFWSAKLLTMSRHGVHVFSRVLRYRNKIVKLPDGTAYTFLTGEEKGVDVRIALDIIRMAHRNEFDVAIVFSQDQDLSEVAEEIGSSLTNAADGSRWLPPSLSALRLVTAEVSTRPTGSQSTEPPTMLVLTHEIIGLRRNRRIGSLRNLQSVLKAPDRSAF